MEKGNDAFFFNGSLVERLSKVFSLQCTQRSHHFWCRSLFVVSSPLLVMVRFKPMHGRWNWQVAGCAVAGCSWKKTRWCELANQVGGLKCRKCLHGSSREVACCFSLMKGTGEQACRALTVGFGPQVAGLFGAMLS